MNGSHTFMCTPFRSRHHSTAAEQQPVVFASLEKGVAAHAKIESVQFEIKTLAIQKS